MGLPGELSENSEKLCSEVFARAVLASLGEADTRTSTTRPPARVATGRFIEVVISCRCRCCECVLLRTCYEHQQCLVRASSPKQCFATPKAATLPAGVHGSLSLGR